MKSKKSRFDYPLLAYLFLAPQVIITIIFFIVPSFNAIKGAFYLSDAFNLHHRFVWFNNFRDLFTDPNYLTSFKVTLAFSCATALLALISALLLAVLIDRVIRLRGLYKTLLIWPYAVAPAVAGILWRFIFNPGTGVCSMALDHLGIHWNYMLNAKQAMLLAVIVGAWQQFSYNFIFFLAGLYAIPRSLIEAAAIDGASPARRFWTIAMPLLSPISFFLLVINLIYAFFNTFGIIQTTTLGGPANATDILVYKVYNDGFVQLNLGSSYAQSVLLLIIVIVLTILQFQYIERKVHY